MSNPGQRPGIACSEKIIAWRAIRPRRWRREPHLLALSPVQQKYLSQEGYTVSKSACYNGQSAALLSDSGLVMYFSTLPAPSSSVPCILTILTHLHPQATPGIVDGKERLAWKAIRPRRWRRSRSVTPVLRLVTLSRRPVTPARRFVTYRPRDGMFTVTIRNQPSYAGKKISRVIREIFCNNKEASA